MVNDDIEVLETEVVEEEVDTSEDISSFESEEQPKTPEAPSEPGYVKGRIDKAVAKERERILSEVKAEMEAQYAPLRERLLEMDAQELVNNGEVKDIETARELVRYRQGQKPAQKPEQPRNADGKFSSKNDANIQFLAKQADRVKAQTGIDVVGIIENDPEIRDKVFSGEMDFHEVAEMAKSRKRPPTPMRTPNGATGYEKNAIESMSDAQFKRLEQKIVEEGVRYTLK